MKVTEKREKKTDTLSSLLLSKLKPFSKHPFKPYNEEKMLELADSIKEQGLISPILVRPIEDKKYSHEIVAGHNRVNAAKNHFQHCSITGGRSRSLPNLFLNLKCTIFYKF